jgi:leucyl-tRNA synthetase
MELNNTLAPFGEESVESGSPQRAELLRFAFDTLVRLLAPMTPHISEELWERTGHRESVFRMATPVADPAYVKSEQFDLVIQVNSKIRARESVPSDTDSDQMKAIALRHPRVIEESGRPRSAQSHRNSESPRKHRRLTVASQPGRKAALRDRGPNREPLRSPCPHYV